MVIGSVLELISAVSGGASIPAPLISLGLTLLIAALLWFGVQREQPNFVIPAIVIMVSENGIFTHTNTTHTHTQHTHTTHTHTHTHTHTPTHMYKWDIITYF